MVRNIPSLPNMNPSFSSSPTPHQIALQQQYMEQMRQQQMRMWSEQMIREQGIHTTSNIPTWSPPQHTASMPTAPATQVPATMPMPMAMPMNNMNPTPPPGNHALQDYQMQMMLLEQQNKRRLQEAGGPSMSSHTPTMNTINLPMRGVTSNGYDGQVSQMKQKEQDIKQALAEARSLPDYQAQLRALEQNNKDILKAAAEEQAAMTAALNNEQRTKDTVQMKSEDGAQQFTQATKENAAKYTKPFCDFLTKNPTVFHAVSAIKTQLKDAGWTELSERDEWDIKPSGKYFVERNGSSMIAFSVGSGYKPGNGAAILAGHVDALTAKLKPVSQVPNKAGYVQLGIAPYAGAPNTTWWDRDLGIGGRVLVKEGDKIVSKLVKLDWPIARIPTLAPHFGAPAYGPFNPETQMVPIIGLDSTSAHDSSEQTAQPFSQPSLLGGGASTFVKTQPPRLVSAIAKELGLSTSEYGSIVNWELELYDVQGANVGGLDKEFIYAGRIDDKLCSWAAIQALIESQETVSSDSSSIMKVVGLFDDEEIGSLLRQGARGNLLPQTIERAVGSLSEHKLTSDLIGRTYANSFLVSADVTHAVNPNFLGSYLENHSPHLNVGLVVSADSNGHMTTDSVSTAVLKRCADKVGANLQVFQIRNDSRSGGTVGPMLSAATGMRAIDAGIPQLSMHSIRATTGSLDPGLGVLAFMGFLNGFEEVDKEFR